MTSMALALGMFPLTIVIDTFSENSSRIIDMTTGQRFDVTAHAVIGCVSVVFSNFHLSHSFSSTHLKKTTVTLILLGLEFVPTTR
ncbi:hypothetical protein EV361DRAFT_899890 [Lentinula raphanica]|nr:hypothetical protein EV361DRAFT_899890 [Lentinula raphanica]